jgi:hypothetical protein
VIALAVAYGLGVLCGGAVLIVVAGLAAARDPPPAVTTPRPGTRGDRP